MKNKNILFVMCDQLRWDYLSCYGHPTLETTNIDRLAKMGVIFDNAFVQSPLCGPSRSSFYTGRYMFTHGATWNSFPLRVDELTIGDYLKPFNVRTALVGKTHMVVDPETIDRLKIASDAELGIHLRECGFEPYVRDDGMSPDPIMEPESDYNRFLVENGYDDSFNPWNYSANSVDIEGDIGSGWLMRHCDKPARVRDEHSETAFMTDRAIDFIKENTNRPWCLHLSYIKPHWPYIVSAPYHNMYSSDDLIPAVGLEADPVHPVHEAFKETSYSKVFAKPEVRDVVGPAYMGLIKQVDDHFGRLLDFLEESGTINDTLIVFTSDHGDYLGDHGLGEKDLYHDQSIKIPMIIVDPSTEADATRGSRVANVVEAIDLLPTFFNFHSNGAIPYRLEGKSLLDITRNTGKQLRNFAITELDYSLREEARRILGLAPKDCRAFIYTSEKWKYVLFEGFESILFDRINDPKELTNLSSSPEHQHIVGECHEAIFRWLRSRHTRTVSEEKINAMPKDFEKRVGILIGVW